MKYLLIEQSRHFSLDYQVKEFATAEELVEQVMRTGAKNLILAQRLDLEVKVCDWKKPVEEEF